MSSISLVYSNRKVCAGWDGQNRRFRSFSNVDPTTRKACKRVLFQRESRVKIKSFKRFLIFLINKI